MASIIIHTNNQKDLSMLQQLALKLGLKAEVLSGSDKEDLILAKAIEENDATDTMKLEEAMAYYQSLDKLK